MLRALKDREALSWKQRNNLKNNRKSVNKNLPDSAFIPKYIVTVI